MITRSVVLLAPQRIDIDRDTGTRVQADPARSATA